MQRENYIAPGQDCPRVPIQFVESTFSAWPLPENGDWKLSIRGAVKHAIEEAVKQFNLSKTDLEVKVSDPSYSSTRLSARDWARGNVITVRPKTNASGLAAANKRLRELNFKVITDSVAQKEELDQAKIKVENLSKKNTEMASQLDEHLMVKDLHALQKKCDDLEKKCDDLEKENKEFKAGMKTLEKENKEFKAGMKTLEETVNNMERKLRGLRVVEKVLLRKLCEAARKKCAEIACSEDIPIPLGQDGQVDWYTLLSHPRLVSLLATNGLTTGLADVRVIPRKLHAAAHDSVKEESVYVQTVLDLYQNNFRSRMENILVFVYPNAEVALAAEFDDDA